MEVLHGLARADDGYDTGFCSPSHYPVQLYRLHSLDSMNAADPVVEERFVYRACQERNVNSIFSTKWSLRVHQFRSKNPRCQTGGSNKIRVITRPGDIIAGGAGGMGHCPPQQHQPPGIDFFLKNTFSKPGIQHLSYTWYIPGIYQVYTMHIPGI